MKNVSITLASRWGNFCIFTDASEIFFSCKLSHVFHGTDNSKTIPKFNLNKFDKLRIQQDNYIKSKGLNNIKGPKESKESKEINELKSIYADKLKSKKV